MVEQDGRLSAQVAVLGSLLIDPSLVGQALERVRPEDFLTPKCRMVFEAIRSLYTEGRPTDPVTVRGRLGGKDGDSWTEYLLELMDLTPTAANVWEYTDQATGKRPTDWIDVVAWDARARFVQQYFRKGRMAIVEGRLQVRDYTGRDGSKRRAVEVVADSVYFGDSKPAPDSEGNADESQLPSPPPQDFADQDDDGELPF